MLKLVKLLITVKILITCGYSSFASECFKIDISMPETGNSKKIKSKISDIDSFISTDRSSNVGDGVFVKSMKSIAKGDDRKVKNSNSPKSLDAVGRLTFTNKEGKRNFCSGSLAGFTAIQDSRIVVTSAHCLKGDNITWETKTKEGKTIKRTAKVIDFNHGTDYAILLLDKKVDHKDVAPLIVDYEEEMNPSDIIYDEIGSPEFAFAGYSADAELGKNGTVLTYDTTGGFTAYENPNGFISGDSNKVTTYSGASGGALIVTYTEEDEFYRPVNVGRQSYLMGVIKGGRTDEFSSSNGVKGSNDTTFVYYKKFYKPLKEHLEKYNGVIENLDFLF